MAFNFKNIFQRRKADKDPLEASGVEPQENLPSLSKETGDREIIESQLKAIEEMRNEKVSGSDRPLEREKPPNHISGLQGASPPRVAQTQGAPATSFPPAQEPDHSMHDTYRESVEDTSVMPPSVSQETSRMYEERKESQEEKEAYGNNQDQAGERIAGSPPRVQAKEEMSPNQTVIEEESGPDLFRRKKNTAKFVRFGIIGFITFFVLGGGAFAGVWLFRSFLATPPLSQEELAPAVAPVETPQEPAELTLAERDSKRVDDLDGLAAALFRYYSAFNSYPPTGGGIVKIFKDTAADSPLARELVPSYSSGIPSDPNATFYYGYSSDASSYELTSLLENQDHAECIVSGNYCIRTIRNGEVVSKK